MLDWDGVGRYVVGRTSVVVLVFGVLSLEQAVLRRYTLSSILAIVSVLP